MQITSRNVRYSHMCNFESHQVFHTEGIIRAQHPIISSKYVISQVL